MDFLTPTAIAPDNQLAALWLHTQHTPLLAYNTWCSKKHRPNGKPAKEAALIVLLHLDGPTYQLLYIPDHILQSTAHALADNTTTLPEACSIFMEYGVCIGTLTTLKRYITSSAPPCTQLPCADVWQVVYKEPTLIFIHYLQQATVPA